MPCLRQSNGKKRFNFGTVIFPPPSSLVRIEDLTDLPLAAVHPSAGRDHVGLNMSYPLRLNCSTQLSPMQGGWLLLRQPPFEFLVPQ